MNPRAIPLRLAALVLLAGPALAEETCPPPADISAALDVLIADAQAAESYMAGRDAFRDMFALWAAAPDGWSGELMDVIQERIAAADYPGAMKGLDALVVYCPSWAEAWNQRAYVRFLQEDYPAALEDIDRALELVPRHVAALSGKGVTLMRMGEAEEGDRILREAVALHPWLPERGLLDPPAGAPR
ncbi:MAG: tetratricopeptide repeat protein [Maritimibacter sp.]|nr:tetratricopeptide repeat protein [Maritimibacter sp.]